MGQPRGERCTDHRRLRRLPGLARSNDEGVAASPLEHGRNLRTPKRACEPENLANDLVRNDGTGLHRYYEQRRMTVRRLDLSDYPSALFQGKATDRHKTRADLVITEQTRNPAGS